jgi:hypothetical protein
MLILDLIFRSKKRGKHTSIWRVKPIQVLYTIAWCCAWYFLYGFLKIEDNSFWGVCVSILLIALIPNLRDLFSFQIEQECEENDLPEGNSH